MITMEVNQNETLQNGLEELEAKPIGKQQLQKFTAILRQYKAGKARTEGLPPCLPGCTTL